MDITYRPALPTDFDFLYRLNAETMRDYVESTFGPWEDAWQVDYFRRHFDPAEVRVIQLDGQDVGMVHLQDRAEEVFIAGIEVLPAYQRRGIGTAVLQEVIANASRQGKPVALQVLKVNISARDLYQRLGFGVTGENDTHYIMAYEKKGRPYP